MKASKDDLEKAKARSDSKASKKAKLSASIDEDNFDDVKDSNDGEVQEAPKDESSLEY